MMLPTPLATTTETPRHITQTNPRITLFSVLNEFAASRGSTINFSADIKLPRKIRPSSEAMARTLTPTVLAWLALICLCHVQFASSFTQQNPIAFRQRSVSGRSSNKPLAVADDLFVDTAETLRAGDFHVPGADDNVQDPNGVEFTVGAVVRVCVEGLKTFQIGPKGLGFYDDDKNFVLETATPETEKGSLKLPVGLRGIVTKVYDEREISANYPILVKFEPGANTEEGYDSPVVFAMHFMPHELECIS